MAQGKRFWRMTKIDKDCSGLPVLILVDDAHGYRFENDDKYIAFQITKSDLLEPWNLCKMYLDGTLEFDWTDLEEDEECELTESDIAAIRNFVANNRYILEVMADEEIDASEFWNYCIRGGESATIGRKAELAEDVDEIIKSGGQKNLLTEMAFTLAQMKERIKSDTKNIVSWWCLLEYIKRFGDNTRIKNHEKGKLIEPMQTLQADNLKVSKKNAKRIKENLIRSYWGDDGIEILSNPNAVKARFTAKLYSENLPFDEKMADELANAFIADAPRLIDLIANKEATDIRAYVDERFPSDVAPREQKPNTHTSNRKLARSRK